jgi:ribonuclease HII
MLLLQKTAPIQYFTSTTQREQVQMKQYPLLTQAPAPTAVIAGIDEAGRGCLAGPVVAAAVILPEKFSLPGLTDSKACSAKKRAGLSPKIRSCALAWGLGLVWPARIDKINILQATFEAMAKAVGCLQHSIPGLLLVDGNHVLPQEHLQKQWCKKHRLPLPAQKAIIAGDAHIPAISAASILAKTFRDRLMTSLARRWPNYGFEKHKGYGTAAHFAAIDSFGLSPQHRRSFVKKHLCKPMQQEAML